MKEAGGVEHVPQGWDHWNGLVGNSRLELINSIDTYLNLNQLDKIRLYNY